MGLGTGEMVLILVVLILAVGPRKLPELARALGKIHHDTKKFLHDGELKG